MSVEEYEEAFDVLSYFHHPVDIMTLFLDVGFHHLVVTFFFIIIFALF
jgi:hypothetical protein